MSDVRADFANRGKVWFAAALGLSPLATCPIKLGQSGVWLNGTASSSVLKYRQVDGSDVILTEPGYPPVRGYVTGFGAAVAAISNGVITASANGALGTLDGLTVAVGDRFLYNPGTSDGGIYTCTSLGAVGAKFSFTRAVDMNVTADFNSGAVISVLAGTVNAGRQFVLSWSGAPGTAFAMDSTVPTFTAQASPTLTGSPCWVGGAAPVLATAGNDTACSNGDVYWGQVLIPGRSTLTGIAYLIGSVGGTDKVISALFDSSGNLIANSALAGATVGTAANVQAVDFTAPVTVPEGKYYIGLQFNGTTAKFRTHTIPGQKFVANSVAGTFGTLAAITPGATFTANKAPMAVTY